MKLAIAYCRCSSSRQEKSISEQRAAIERWAREHDFQVVEWFEDEGITGSVFEERPGFRGMLDACQRLNGTVSAVLVWDKARFGRPGEGLKEASIYEREIENTGKSIIYVSSGRVADGSFESAIVDVVENAAAADFLHKLSATLTRHHYENAKAGYSTGRKAPFGYDLIVLKVDGSPRFQVHFTAAKGKNKYTKSLLDPQTGAVKDELGPDACLPRFERTDRSRLVLGNPGEVAVVKEIYTAYLRGSGFKAIADTLNTRRAPSPNGRLWYDSTVREILMNPVYTGAMVAGRRCEGKFNTLQKDEGTLRRKTRPVRTKKGNVKVELRQESEWIVVENTHPAIVTREDWEEVQRQRAQRDKTKSGRGRPGLFRLSGLVICEKCGHKYTGMSRKNQKGTPWSCYVCSGRMNAGRSVCDWNTVRQDKLETPIVDMIKEMYLSIEDEKELERTVRAELSAEVENRAPERERLRGEVVEADRKIRVLVDQIVAHPEHADVFSVQIAAAKTAKAEAEAKVAKLEQRRSQDAALERAIHGAMEEIQRFRGMFEAGDVEAQKEVIRAFVKEVRVNYATREVTVLLYPLSKMLVGPKSLSLQEIRQDSAGVLRLYGGFGGGARSNRELVHSTSQSQAKWSIRPATHWECPPAQSRA